MDLDAIGSAATTMSQVQIAVRGSVMDSQQCRGAIELLEPKMLDISKCRDALHAVKLLEADA